MSITLRKVIYGAGFCGALLAMEGLNRLGGFVAAIGGEDAPFYMAFLLVSVIAAGIFLLSFFKDIPYIVKRLLSLALFVSGGLMLEGPALPVSEQIELGLFIAALATFAIPKPAREEENK